MIPFFIRFFTDQLEFYDYCYCCGRPEIKLFELRKLIAQVGFMGIIWDITVCILKDILSFEIILHCLQ